MAQFFSIVIAAVVFLFEFALVYGLDIVLDQQSDLDPRWQIRPGKSPYITSGSDLRGTFNKYLPGDFKYEYFSSYKGIWTVVPNMDSPCNLFQVDDDMFKSSENTNENSTDSREHTTPKPDCNVTSAENFKFIVPNRSISGIRIQYNFGGNATMRITVENGIDLNEQSSTPGSKRMKKWQQFDTYIEDHATEVTFTGIVSEKNSYILIDKITVTVEDSPDPTPVPRHSTTSSKTTTTPASSTEPTTNSPNPPNPPTTVNPDSPTTPSPAPASGQESLFPRFGNLLMSVFLVAFCIIV